MIEGVYLFTEAVEGKPNYFQGRHEPVPPYSNFGGNQNAKTSQVALGCETVARKYNGRETIDMKAVLNHFQSYFVIISDKCNKLNVSNEQSFNEAGFDYCIKKLCKQSKIDRHLHL